MVHRTAAATSWRWRHPADDGVPLTCGGEEEGQSQSAFPGLQQLRSLLLCTVITAGERL